MWVNMDNSPTFSERKWTKYPLLIRLLIFGLMSVMFFTSGWAQAQTFDFIDQFDVSRSVSIISEAATITGISGNYALTIANGEYSINGGDFTSAHGTVTNLDQIRVRITSPSNYGNVATAQVSIDGVSASFSVRTEDDPNTGWASVPTILNRINPPVFPALDFNITDYGAVGDGQLDCSEAFKDAIEACHDAGGGRVIVPQGSYLTGAIHLKSNVNLYISENATVKFSQNPADYLPIVYTRYEGTECYNYSPPIYAFEQQNIAITGSGTLNGQGDNTHWWNWTQLDNQDVSQLRQQAEDGVPVAQRVYGDGHHLRPNMIQPYHCQNVLIDSVTIKNSPMWHVHPVLCTNLTIQNMTVVGHGPNNDGCNPESCRDVWIKNCYFNTGDDCIAIKSGRNADGRRVNVATENVIIQNCTMKDGHGGVVMGSEISGSCRNIFAEDCSMNSPNLNRALRLKTNSIRGGVIENVYLRNITVGQVSEAAFKINFYYGEGDISDFPPIVRNVEIRNMTVQNCRYALLMRGYARSPISNIRIIDSEFRNTDSQNSISEVQNLILQNVSINAELTNKIINPVNDNPTSVKKYEHETAIPGILRLFPVYPNPFNCGTTIRYYIPYSNHVSLVVYDILGRQVATLVDEYKHAGHYSFLWNAENSDDKSLSSGVYYARLKNGFNSKTVKLLYVR